MIEQLLSVSFLNQGFFRKGEIENKAGNYYGALMSYRVSNSVTFDILTTLSHPEGMEIIILSFSIDHFIIMCVLLSLSNWSIFTHGHCLFYLNISWPYFIYSLPFQQASMLDITIYN